MGKVDGLYPYVFKERGSKPLKLGTEAGQVNKKLPVERGGSSPTNTNLHEWNGCVGQLSV